jgi:hypothetical protein
MIGALGELIGAAAVVLTLGYLATQVRQSTTASRQEAVRELMDQTGGILSWISYSPQRSHLWIRGTSGDPDLSVEELGQFRAHLFQLVLIWQRLYFLDEAATVDPWFANFVAKVRQELVGTPGFASWYEIRRHWLDPKFQAVVEAEMRGHFTYRPMGLGEEELRS